MQGTNSNEVSCLVLRLSIGQELAVRIPGVICCGSQHDDFFLQYGAKPITNLRVVQVARQAGHSNQLWVWIVSKRANSLGLAFQIKLNCGRHTFHGKYFRLRTWNSHDASMQGLSQPIHRGAWPGGHYLLTFLRANNNLTVVPDPVWPQIEVLNFLVTDYAAYGVDLQFPNRNLLLYGAWCRSLQTLIPVSTLTGILGSEPCTFYLLESICHKPDGQRDDQPGP